MLQELRVMMQGERNDLNDLIDLSVGVPKEGDIIVCSYVCKETHTNKEVIVYAEGIGAAVEIAASHFRTTSQAIDAHKIGHVVWFTLDRGLETERLVQRYLITDEKYDCKMHVDNGAVACTCCVGKADVPHAWKKKK